MTLPPSRPRAFYGWRVVGGVFVMMAFSSGLGFYNQSVLLESLTDERGFSIAAASLATTIFFACSGLAGLGIASLLDRFDARFTITAGATLAAVAMAVVGRVESLGQLYLIFALFGCGFAGANMLPATTLIARWFERRRPIALAVASTGLSVGGIALTPLAARAIERLSLDSATLLLAVLFWLGVVPCALLVIRDRPQSLGQLPDGSPPSPEAARPLPGVPARTALRSRFFRGLVAAYVCGLLAQVGGLAHQFKLIADAVDTGVAAAGVSTVASASIVGRLAAGWLLGWVSMRGLTLGLLALQGGALLLLSVAHGATGLLLSSAVFGLSIGSFLLMQPLLIAEAFGVAHYPRIFSIANVIGSGGVALGPAVVGTVRGLAHSYTPAYAVAAGFSFVGMLFLWAAGPLPQTDAPE